MVTRVQERYKVSNSQKDVPMTIQNLYTVLAGFQTDHCQIVIDNWQSLDIKQTILMPTIIRNFELAFSHRKLHVKGKYLEYLDQILMPKPNVFKSNTLSRYWLRDDKYHDCPISSLYYPLTAKNVNEAFCVDLVHEMFLLNSKPWQCEIQVSLFMSKHVSGNFPGFFRYHYDMEFKFMPSTRPKIHIRLDFKSVHDLDSFDLLDWITHSKIHEDIVTYHVFKTGYSSQTLHTVVVKSSAT